MKNYVILVNMDGEKFYSGESASPASGQVGHTFAASPEKAIVYASFGSAVEALAKLAVPGAPNGAVIIPDLRTWA